MSSAKASTPPLSAWSRPAASIARSITWGFWWRKAVEWLVLDLVLAAALAYGFVARSNATIPAAAAGDGGWWVPSDRAYLEGEGSLSTFAYVVEGLDDRTYRFAVTDELAYVGPALGALALIEVGSLLGFFSDTRRVRRALQPLNDLALMADSIGSGGVGDPMAADALGDGSKRATLEQAISRASVDSPAVFTGDTDLRPIEVALNNLLRQMQAAKLQQMRFVSDASHELRTPIAVIQGYVNMLDRWGMHDEEVMRESIQALKSESEHMQELVEQLLFLARGDSGRNALQRQEVNLAGLMREVCDESAMIDGGHLHSCPLTESDAAEARFKVTGDLAMIKQSLRIIVQNAEKYSPVGSTITLGCTEDAAGVTCLVQDEGIGMSATDVHRAFERFWRSEGARAEGAPGSGLGLSIAKWIVDAHGGTVEVLSREGVGTRFSLRYPR